MEESIDIFAIIERKNYEPLLKWKYIFYEKNYIQVISCATPFGRKSHVEILSKRNGRDLKTKMEHDMDRH